MNIFKLYWAYLPVRGGDVIYLHPEDTENGLAQYEHCRRCVGAQNGRARGA